MSINSLGLDKAKVEKEIEVLNVLLSNYQTYYQNLREELYNAAQEQVDQIAERILTLGGVPFNTLASYVKHATIPVGENVSDDDKAVRLIVDSIIALLPLERELLSLSDEINDEGTNTLVSDLIVEQEKNLWMLKSYLSESI